MSHAPLFTIGFTKKSARTFFELLRESGVKRLLDVRLHNQSQLAGFAKRDDLAYFAHELCTIEYTPVPELAPTAEILERYREDRNWPRYQRDFLALLKRRRVEETLPRELFAGGCLLCSEDEPHRCHRRLAAEYLQRHWSNLEVRHLPERDSTR